MFQPAVGLGLAQEPLEVLRIVGVGFDDLDRDRAPQRRVEGFVHLAHPACAEQGFHAKWADSRR
jgi:hypothetical protein